LPASDPIGELSMTDAAVSHIAVVAEPRSRAPTLGEEGRQASGIAGIGAISRIGGGEPGWCYFISIPQFLDGRTSALRAHDVFDGRLA
jgi:hypothetical protein